MASLVVFKQVFTQVRKTVWVVNTHFWSPNSELFYCMCRQMYFMVLFWSPCATEVETHWLKEDKVVWIIRKMKICEHGIDCIEKAGLFCIWNEQYNFMVCLALRVVWDWKPFVDWLEWILWRLSDKVFSLKTSLTLLDQVFRSELKIESLSFSSSLDFVYVFIYFHLYVCKVCRLLKLKLKFTLLRAINTDM